MDNKERNKLKRVTVFGRLSFPTLTAQQAFDRNKGGQFPDADVASAKPDFELVLSQSQWDKFTKHATEVFLPYVVENVAKGKMKIDDLEQDEADDLKATLLGDLSKQRLNTPAKAVKPEMLELVPDAVAVVKGIGPAGGEISVHAVVNSESELAVPDPEILAFPVVKPINQTTHKLYAGCYATATLSLYAYRNGKNPGFSAKATSVVFKADADPFGGGGADIDMDEVFADE